VMARPDWIVGDRMVPLVEAWAACVSLLDAARVSEGVRLAAGPEHADVVSRGFRQAEGLLYLMFVAGRN